MLPALYIVNARGATRWIQYGFRF